jgi:hypothetical protein
LDSSGNLESFEMQCWRRMEKISWADHVENEEVTATVRGEWSILHKVKRTANWNGHILCMNCVLQHVMECRTEVCRNHKQLLDSLKETSENWKMELEALCIVLTLEDVEL